MRVCVRCKILFGSLVSDGQTSSVSLSTDVGLAMMELKVPDSLAGEKINV